MCDPPKSARWFLLIAACPTFIQLHHAKLELMAGKYSESAKAMRLANNYFQSSRLRRVEWIIRIAPGALRLLYIHVFNRNYRPEVS